MKKRRNKSTRGGNAQTPQQKNTNSLSRNVTLPRSKAPSGRVVKGSDIILTHSTTPVEEFQTLKVNLNPGLESVFPSLSLEARRYDRYHFESLTFELVSTNAVMTSKGMVGLLWEPNAMRSSPSTLAASAACEHFSMKSVYSPNRLSVPKNSLGPIRWVRNGAPGGDLNLYDTGNFSLIMQSCNENREGGQFSPITLIIKAHYTLRFYDYHLEGPADIFRVSESKTHSASARLGMVEATGYPSLTGPGSGGTLPSDYLVNEETSLGGLLQPITGGAGFRMPSGHFWVTFSWDGKIFRSSSPQLPDVANRIVVRMNLLITDSESGDFTNRWFDRTLQLSPSFGSGTRSYEQLFNESGSFPLQLGEHTEISVKLYQMDSTGFFTEQPLIQDSDIQLTFIPF